MANYTVEISSKWTIEKTFAFMSDMQNFISWDPGIKNVKLLAGPDKGLGCKYHLVIGGVFRDINLEYEIIEYRDPHIVTFYARNSIFTSLDTIKIAQSTYKGESSISYNAILEFNGLWRLFNPLLNPLFKRIVNRATVGLRQEVQGNAT